MKNYLLLAFSLLLFSCGEKDGEKQADFSNITFQIDTVLIDPGDQIVMAASNMFLSGFSNDYSRLYNYDVENGELEVIDLDLLKLEKKLPVEKEGPNGVGVAFWFDYWNDSLFAFYTHTQIKLFDHNLKNVGQLDLRNSPVSKMGLGLGYRFHNSFCFLESPKRVLAPVENFGNDYLHFADMDFENEKTEIIDDTRLHIVNDYKIRLIQGRTFQSVIQPHGLLYWKNSTYIFNQANNEILKYHFEENKVIPVNVQTGKIPVGKSKAYRLETESYQEFVSQVGAMQEEIAFGKLVVNTQSGEFYRIAHRKTQASYEGNPSKWDVFLIKYDPDFKLLAEIKIIDNGQIPEYYSDYFVKENKLWVRLNIHDELAFIRIKVT